MSLSRNVGQLIKNEGLPGLVQSENFVGWVYSIDYDTALVMTNDLWKLEAKGIPHNCFLVAASFDPGDFTNALSSEQEVILLRVVGSARLPQDDDLVRTKVDHFKEQQGIFSDNGARDFDDITLNEIQFGGLQCRVLGTFFFRNGDLWLGSDLESFSTATRLNVYRPRGKALEVIVNYVDPIRRATAQADAATLGLKRVIAPLTIGSVRYTSTDRLHRADDEPRVSVSIQPSDFLARRTAVLGMTRTGKSNLIKQVVSVVKQISSQNDVRIGQIIYDINGEYANPNQQDEGAIATIFPEDTVRYRMVETEDFRDLRNNFYEQLIEGFAVIKREIRTGGDYIAQFREISLDEPDSRDRGEWERWRRRVAAYQVLLYKAGFTPPNNHQVRFSASKNVRDAVDQVVGGSLPNPNDGVSLDVAEEWLTNARELHRSGNLPPSSSGKPWIDEDLQTLLNMIARKSQGTNSFITGYGLLAPVSKYHANRRATDVAREIYELLEEGKIVILDLSVGDPTMRENISKQIASEIFNGSMAVFIEGKTPPNIVVYIEEAHNLIGKELDLTDTWPRLAKEGAKYRIALVYATQEVSSVHANILANTENWFITHLNNEREIREVSRFYDFADFQRSLVRAQDVGFARVKTLSSPFVIPVQIDKFDPVWMEGQASPDARTESDEATGQEE